MSLPDKTTFWLDKHILEKKKVFFARRSDKRDSQDNPLSQCQLMVVEAVNILKKWKVNPCNNGDVLRDNHSAGVDNLIKLHAWPLALSGAARRKNDISTHYCGEHMGRQHNCQTQGPVHGGFRQALCCLLAHSWGWAKSMSTHRCNIKVLISS